MARNKIDDQLLDWKELKGEEWNALLLGNGFSVNIWDGYNYHSLFELAESEDIDFPLPAAAIELFRGKDTTNFENILNLLLGALLADQVINGEQSKKLEKLYYKIQKALISAVQASHVPPDIIDTRHISNEMARYDSIFTTNYDLIPYWSIMDHNTDKFRDYFWGDGNSFDNEDTEIWNDRTRILYLHGALHILAELEGDVIWKNTADDLNLLEQFPDTFKKLYRPLFISEGDSNQKLVRIYSSEYLRFAYSEFTKHNDSLVIMGQSLDPYFDHHLIDAISEWGRKKIAVSVWPKMSSDDIIEFKARINKHLRRHKLYYFDSTTHPLGIEALNC